MAYKMMLYASAALPVRGRSFLLHGLSREGEAESIHL